MTLERKGAAELDEGISREEVQVLSEEAEERQSRRARWDPV